MTSNDVPDGADRSYHVRRADGPVIAEVVVPPSKSIVNRALVCAALAEGTSEIVGVAPGDDTAAMIACAARTGSPGCLPLTSAVP